MMRVLFLLCIPFLLMGNTISALEGPRLVVPRAIDTDTVLTFTNDDEFLVADIFEIDRMRLVEGARVSVEELNVELPAGMMLSTYFANPKEKFRWSEKVYCSGSLADILGGRDALPRGFSRKKTVMYRVCFFADGENRKLQRVFISNADKQYSQIRNITPVAVDRVIEQIPTGDRIYWEFSKVRGGKNPKAKLAISSYKGDVKYGGAGVYWEGDGRKGKTDWLTEVGSKDLQMPVRVDNIMGLFDVSVVSADAKADTVSLVVEKVHDPVMFVREIGVPQRTIYVYLP